MNVEPIRQGHQGEGRDRGLVSAIVHPSMLERIGGRIGGIVTWADILDLRKKNGH